ncbi:E3 ubiquitin-protein ligase RNF19A-like isoform X1 [Mytilus trossulus]|uniref:E3 ubiquitin-protein ligase RNF19A-like isoform X1 n=1 Tax=Mytilus trossulus TaxID=6551 RepID=UPI003004EE22
MYVQMLRSQQSNIPGVMRKRDSEVTSVSSGNSRGSERRKNRFSLRRLFYVTQGTTANRRTRSHVSLDSDSGRSDASVLAPPDREILPRQSSSVDTHSLSHKKGSSISRECPLCLNTHPSEEFPDIMTCHHRSCITCLQTYLQIEITESRINISCPECTEKYHPNDIQMILQNDILVKKYEDFMVRRVLVTDPDARWCPAPDCGYAVIAKECAGCPRIRCERPGCETDFCYHCKQYWHPNKTCDAARAERASSNLRSPSVSYSHDNDSQKDDIKPCPRCGAFIMKMNDGSCNHMACPVCGAEFCWLCMKEISDLHYLSPSGCTFWGKKPWSRKKKILWQLGTLVGAPVGITLIAGIAVPAMIIGIPVWVGRKIHSKYKLSPKHRRNLAITGGVATSILVSPVVAGLAVGIGVPILLAYVYGVVPISLCRSGGCGVTATNKGGVRFEFDEENETVGPAGPDTQSVGTGHNVANPSIAPSIGDASLGMTNSLSASGSHMDRVGVIRDEISDRDSASNRAIGGYSLNGSLCGGNYYTQKLEIQADVSSNMPDTRDKDSSSVVTATSAYEVQVDMPSRGRHSSVESTIVSAKQRNVSGQSSPISGCSAYLSGPESQNTKCRKCKRHNNSNSDKSCEQSSVHFADQVSLCDDVTTHSISEESDKFLGYLTSESAHGKCFTSRCSELKSGIPPCQSRFQDSNASSLPEVEVDRPSLKESENARKAVSTSALPLSQFKLSHKSLCKSKSQEDCALSDKSKVGRVRHRSCELAMETGRISPTEENDNQL